MVKRKCKYCGTEFETWPCWIRKGGGKFCSRECSTTWRRIYGKRGKDSPKWTRVEKVCEQCDESFWAIHCRKDTARFCSLICMSQWQAEHWCGDTAPAWKGGKIEKVCEVCGKSFAVWPSNIVYSGSRFCSRECQSKWHSEEMKGKGMGADNPMWRGGTSFEPYPATFNIDFKRMIRQRDGYECAVCGEKGSSVHHINYIKEDTIPENCITLCRIHHSKTNTNREYWQEKLSAMMEGLFV